MIRVIDVVGILQNILHRFRSVPNPCGIIFLDAKGIHIFEVSRLGQESQQDQRCETGKFGVPFRVAVFAGFGRRRAHASRENGHHE